MTSETRSHIQCILFAFQLERKRKEEKDVADVAEVSLDESAVTYAACKTSTRDLFSLREAL